MSVYLTKTFILDAINHLTAPYITIGMAILYKPTFLCVRGFNYHLGTILFLNKVKTVIYFLFYFLFYAYVYLFVYLEYLPLYRFRVWIHIVLYNI